MRKCISQVGLILFQHHILSDIWWTVLLLISLPGANCPKQMPDLWFERMFMLQEDDVVREKIADNKDKMRDDKDRMQDAKQRAQDAKDRTDALKEALRDRMNSK